MHAFPTTAVRTAGAALLTAASMTAARADDPGPASGPCSVPVAAALADRPGTGRTTSSGGSPCVALPGQIIVESGLRRQITLQPNARIPLASGPLTFARAGVFARTEIGVALPAPQHRATYGAATIDAASGVTDVTIAAKYLLFDAARMQGSLGASYAPPTARGAFGNGAPTFSLSFNAALALSPKLALTTSQTAATAVAGDAAGANRTFFVWAPSFSLAYALDAVDTLLLGDALVSREGPVLPAGNRAVLALQHAFGARFAFDAEYELNLAPSLGSHAHAVGAGFVWIAAPARARMR